MSANKRSFKPGQSGNPAGRPSAGAMLVRKALQGSSQELIDKAIALALEGDTVALRLCIERLTPPIKASAERVTFDIPEDAGLAGTSRAIIAAAAAGQIPPDTASQLVTAMGQLSRQIEIDEISQRISQLEDLK
ncbi:DUF5681 domain-containing protein [Cobetia sp. QF-1]|uniref:DUF5681 domain-containing protein n=1 Tax=Cobetia sp. QF-1 TaxID=1969833 RepID=UPI0011314483|nr:DUF5681 domain-containing protein [Cobetia sp. QF-1]